MLHLEVHWNKQAKLQERLEEKVQLKKGIVNVLTTIGSGNNPVNKGSILVKDSQ